MNMSNKRKRKCQMNVVVAITKYDISDLAYYTEKS